jgi:hypothetical protein
MVQSVFEVVLARWYKIKGCIGHWDVSFVHFIAHYLLVLNATGSHHGYIIVSFRKPG